MLTKPMLPHDWSNLCQQLALAGHAMASKIACHRHAINLPSLGTHFHCPQPSTCHQPWIIFSRQWASMAAELLGKCVPWLGKCVPRLGKCVPWLPTIEKMCVMSAELVGKCVSWLSITEKMCVMDGQMCVMVVHYRENVCYCFAHC